jgi:Flp pilus assembly protein CpaB
MNKKDLLPIIIAFFIALLVTGIVKWLIPSSLSNAKKDVEKSDISMPNIPLMVKEEKKKNAKNYVLVTNKDIKKDEKIRIDLFTWEKWPIDSVKSHFIAKNDKGDLINNKSDYDNALKMWAKADIPNGVPLTMALLTNEDPIKKIEEAKKKKVEQKKAVSFIKNGMRAVTFSVDSKSAASFSMLAPGDLVDVLIMEQRAEKSVMHKYKALKILAIDGLTKFEKKSESNGGGGLLSGVGLGSVGGLLTTPKNVTLEVKESMVETMLKQANNTGIILSIRSQKEPVNEKDGVEDSGSDSEISQEESSILNGILSINRANSTDALLEEKSRKEEEERSLNALMNNINTINNIENSTNNGALQVAQDRKVAGGKYEIVSGKIIGEEAKIEDKKSVTIYRKLTPSTVEFDENGKITTDRGGSVSGAIGNIAGNMGSAGDLKRQSRK